MSKGWLWGMAIYAALGVVTPSSVTPGDWHRGGDLVCSQCHTVHNSQNNRPMRYDNDPSPAENLLRHATATQLCLYCHDGSQPAAPDVTGPVSTPYSPDEHSGAGFFGKGVGEVNPFGHDLSVPSSAVPFSTLVGMTLTCTLCHDPHGNGNYRNLRSSPSGRQSILLTVSNPSQPSDPIFVGVRPNGFNPSEAYRASNIGYKANMVAWCGECHDALAANQTASSPAHFQGHPSNATINPFGYHTDPANWTGGTGEGFGAVTGDGARGVPRVRYQVPAATNFVESRFVAGTNQVFCTSCHLAHGGNYRGGLVWPYKEGGADMASPCQQCHKQ